MIARQGPGYRLHLPRDAVNAWRFEQLLYGAAASGPDERATALAEALALWRGPALADYVGEPWLTSRSSTITVRLGA